MKHFILSIALLFFAEATWSQDVTEVPTPEGGETPGVQWRSLLNESFRFLVIEHAFRYATERGTRHPGRPFFQGYIDSVGALHGWEDGDPFYVNYVGHPMQGAVTGYLWNFNDTRFRRAEFGRDPDYWKSRLRAGAFAWAYGEQMEIGPFSEASLGSVQAKFPQQGLADHVVTPAIGLGWMIAEDALDRYLVRFVERKTHNRMVRILVRGGANPSRSLANMLSGQWPWARPRDDGYDAIALRPRRTPRKIEQPERRHGVAPFEFTANTYAFAAPTGTCLGGGASTAFRIHAEWQMVLDINGCKMTGLEKNLTGDSLSYMAGPRWTPPVPGNLIPYAQVLFGGNKLTQALMLPTPPKPSAADPDPVPYAKQFELDGFAMAAGVGLDLQLNRALAVRLLGVEYTRSWVPDLNGFAAPNGFQVKAGLVLHMGTW